MQRVWLLDIILYIRVTTPKLHETQMMAQAGSEEKQSAMWVTRRCNSKSTAQPLRRKKGIATQPQGDQEVLARSQQPSGSGPVPLVHNLLKAVTEQGVVQVESMVQ